MIHLIAPHIPESSWGVMKTQAKMSVLTVATMR